MKLFTMFSEPDIIGFSVSFGVIGIAGLIDSWLISRNKKILPMEKNSFGSVFSYLHFLVGGFFLWQVGINIGYNFAMLLYYMRYFRSFRDEPLVFLFLTNIFITANIYDIDDSYMKLIYVLTWISIKMQILLHMHHSLSLTKHRYARMTHISYKYLLMFTGVFNMILISLYAYNLYHMVLPIEVVIVYWFAFGSFTLSFLAQLFLHTFYLVQLSIHDFDKAKQLNIERNEGNPIFYMEPNYYDERKMDRMDDVFLARLGNFNNV